MAVCAVTGPIQATTAGSVGLALVICKKPRTLEGLVKVMASKPAVSLERCGALYPAIGPRDIMQALWDSNQDTLEGPVVVLIPGTLQGARTYLFINTRKEFMYRGDLL